MNTRRRSASRTLQFDALEGKTLLSTVALGIRPPAQVAPLNNNNVGQPGINVQTNDFDHTGGRTEYDLTFTSGRYKFIQNYEMKIKSINGRPNDGINAVDAMQVFLDRAYSLLYRNRPVPVAQANRISAAQNSDYAITSENLKQRGGYIKYEMTIESGAYKFDQEYTFKLKRVNRGPNNGATAVEAIDLFTFGLVSNVERVLLHRPVPA